MTSALFYFFFLTFLGNVLSASAHPVSLRFFTRLCRCRLAVLYGTGVQVLCMMGSSIMLVRWCKGVLKAGINR